MDQPSRADSYVSSAVLEHVKKFWANSVVFEEHWKEGPIEDNLPGLQILRVVSRTPGRPIIYVTNGCFVVELAQHIRHEFFLISPRDDLQPVETLTMARKLPR